MKDLLVRKNLNRPLIHIFIHREIGVFVPIVWNSKLKWKFLKCTEKHSNISIKVLCICVYLSLHFYFSFYSFSFAFLLLQSHTSTCANLWHLCWLYRQGPVLLQISNSHKTAPSQMRVQGHTCPLAEGTPGWQYMPSSCQTEHSAAKLTPLGVSKALPGLHIQGCKGPLHFAEHLNTDCSWILGPIFSDAFKAGTNNTKLGGGHWPSPSHLKFHVLPSVH